MRRLATIQKIVNITPIENADKIEVATVLAWECVIAKKDNFKIGDLVVYIEIDSIVPPLPIFEFLRERKFRVKTIKLRKQISQGLVMPLSILPEGTSIIEDADVTEILGITQHDPQLQEEQADVTPVHRSQAMKLLMRIPIFRKVYIALNSQEKGNWPDWIQKTDENRIQVCAKIIMQNFDNPWYLTEKLDGQSGSFFTHKVRKWGFPSWEFGVCSRNVWLKTENNSNYWKVAKKYDLENKMKSFKEEMVIQGEILNTNVQGNKYKVTEPMFYVFNIVENGVRLPLQSMLARCSELGLTPVPLVCDSFIPNCHWLDKVENTQAIVQEIVKMSDGKSVLLNIPREGIVWRLVDNPQVSFKAINPTFLLGEKD